MLTKVDWPGKGTLAFAEGNSIFFFFIFLLLSLLLLSLGVFFFLFLFIFVRVFSNYQTFLCTCVSLLSASLCRHCKRCRVHRNCRGPPKTVVEVSGKFSKRMAIYLKVQQEVKSFDLSKMSRQVITKKLKKACHTRWLSLDHTVEAIFDDFEALMRTLRLLESDATACGLLKKIHCSKFVACVYSQAHSSCPLSAEQNIPKRMCKLH